jgi:hypothetical protein
MTDKQIQAEIDRLLAMKPQIRRYTMFGDDNWAKIDLMVKVLEDQMTEDDLMSYLDDEAEDLQMTDDQRCELESDGFHVIGWMEGDEDESPSSGWECLMPKPVEPEKKPAKRPAKKAAKKGKK